MMFLIFPNGCGVTAVATAHLPGGAHRMPRRRRSARLAAQLATGHRDDVHDRRRGEEGEDPREHGTFAIVTNAAAPREQTTRPKHARTRRRVSALRAGGAPANP